MTMNLQPITPELIASWIQPGVLVALGGLFVAVFRGVKTDIAEAKAELKGDILEVKADLNAREVRLDKRIDDVKTDLKVEISDVKVEIKAVGEKLDRVLESLLAARV